MNAAERAATDPDTPTDTTTGAGPATPPGAWSFTPIAPAGPEHRVWSLRRWMIVVGALAVVYALLAIMGGTVGLTRLATARAFVVDTVQPALSASDDLTTALVDQESGVRGFLLTGREEFLEPYESGQEREQAALGELRRLAAGGSLDGVDRELDAVVTAAEAWRRSYADPVVATVRATGPAVGPTLSATGKLQFDSLRAQLQQLDDMIRAARDAATDRLQRGADFMRMVFIAIAVGFIVLIVLVGWWLYRSVSQPISRLAAEVRDVVSGDAHREVRSDGPLEIASLATDVDTMRRHIIAELDALADAHRRLDEQARDLERSNRDLEQFAYVASHDLQEPLRKVSSFCQLLQRRYGGQLDERADSYIAFAVDGAGRMQQLINDLLAFSRVGRVTAGFVDVDLKEAAETAVAQLSTACEETGAEVHVGELPTVRGEAPLLVLMITNLVGNAIKFSRPGVPPEITIDATPAEPGPDGGELWEVSVADNGIGVEPEYADKVFVIFQRLHARDDYPGTGIGLAMAKKIVEYHGGRIWIDPERTGGTTVRFTLPAGTDTESAATSLEESASW